TGKAKHNRGRGPRRWEYPDEHERRPAKKSQDYKSVICTRYDYSQCHIKYPLLMTFEDFQNRARLYVIGALYPAEITEFQQATTQFGTKAKTFIQDCYALRDAFALSLRAPESRAALKDRVV